MPHMPEEAITPDTEAEQCVNQVLNLSNGIIQALHAEKLQELAQLLMKRGRLINALSSLNLKDLQDETKSKLQQKLDRINALEPEIQSRLKAMTLDVEAQLRATVAHRNVASGYRLSDEGTSTRSDQA